MNPLLMSFLLVLAAGFFGWFVYEKSMLLVSLSPENRFDNITARVKALLGMGIGQEKLIGRKKERTSGIMHAFIFWGFLILGVRTVTLGGEGFVLGFHLPFLGSEYIFGFLYTFLKDIFEGIVLFMIGFAAYRRLILKPKRLTNSGEAWFVLFMISSLMVTDLFYDAAKFNIVKDQLATSADVTYRYLYSVKYGFEWQWTPIANLFEHLLPAANTTSGNMINFLVMHLSYWFHMAVVLTFLCFLPGGKHFHVITALPNVFFKSLDYPHTKAPVMDLEDEEAWENETLGVNHIHQLSWKQALDIYSCTECGRCEEVCPTYVTNKPLSLKSFNTSIKYELFDNMHNIIERAKLEKTLAGTEDETKREEIKEKMEALKSEKALVGDVISEDTLWACTTCRACEQVCPVGIEHVPRIISLRQGQTMLHEAQPSEVNVAFKGLERNANPWGIGYDKRADWAKDLDITTMADNKDVDYLFWVGCAGSFDERSQKVTKATAQLMTKAGVKFSILGTEEKCTGDFARRSGNEMLFQEMASSNIETLNGYGVKKIVTTCPHCLNTLKNEYGDFGGDYEVVHHSQFLTNLVDEGKIKLKKSIEGKLTYHDPCYLGRYNNVYKEPRQILGAIATEGLTELKRHGKESFCCGAGGARMWMEETIGKRINIERVDEAASIEAEIVAVGCPFCLTMIDDGIKGTGREEKMKTLDISELMLASVEA
ncbi:MAG: Fe-S oxidoreductase [bacterium]|jgi:Fe-S oxidoreductase